MQPPSTTSSAGPSSVRVELGPRSYSAEVGPGVLAAIGGRVRDSLGNRCRKALLVIDQAVPGKFADLAESSLRESGLEVARATLHASEHEKSLHSFGALLQQLAGLRLERRDVLVALGGGVIGDLAGFAAASYRRGIPFVQCPTTLLSMVDASVGGKTAINIDLGPGSGLVKNMAGAFHQPIAVLADTLTLESLEPRQYRCGMAECIKHAMIGADFQDPSLLDWTRRHASSPAQSAEISELITRNVAIKARVVAGDEREEREGAGGRALLNLGHTFGHAIEALPGAQGVLAGGQTLPGEIQHGEAVALGLRAALAAAVRLGSASQEYGALINSLLDSFSLPARASGLPETGAVVDRMRHDKKNLAGSLRLILPCGQGRATVVENPPEQAVREAIDSIRA